MQHYIIGAVLGLLILAVFYLMERKFGVLRKLKQKFRAYYYLGAVASWFAVLFLLSLLFKDVDTELRIAGCAWLISLIVPLEKREKS